MRAVRALVLAGTVAWSSAAATAMPLAPQRHIGSSVGRIQLVCGPDRCFRRPFWHYGRGVGFLPLRPLGRAPFRRFGPGPFRPFGFGRFGGFRR